jgi:type II secretory pathway component GspD/PulD (secretin)
MFFKSTKFSPKIISLYLLIPLLLLPSISKGGEKGIYETESQKEYIKVSIQDVDIKILFLAISQVSGKNIVIAPDVEKKVSCKIEGE